MTMTKALSRLNCRVLAATSIVITGALVAALGCGPADAYQLDNGHRLTYGVSGQKYWLSASAVNNNEDAITAGVALWNATATPVSFSRTSTQSVSRMDFYNDGGTGSGNCAYTWWCQHHSRSCVRAELVVVTGIHHAEVEEYSRMRAGGTPQSDRRARTGPRDGSRSRREIGPAYVCRNRGHRCQRPTNDDINGISYLY